MGWDIFVNNYWCTDGEINEIYLCADIFNSEKPSRLSIEFCAIPSFLYRIFPGDSDGSNWVVSYNETAWCAIISGRSPSIKTTDGTCKNVDNAGLWFFFRGRKPSDADINASFADAEALGYEIDVLTDLCNITQSNCPDRP